MMQIRLSNIVDTKVFNKFLESGGIKFTRLVDDPDIINIDSSRADALRYILSNNYEIDVRMSPEDEFCPVLQLYDIQKRWYAGDYNVPYKSYTMFSLDHVFDEDQTVKWNRQKVEIENKLLEDARKADQDRQHALYCQLDTQITICIVSETHLTFDQAKMVYGYLYADYHHCMDELFNQVDRYADRFDRVVSCTN